MNVKTVLLTSGLSLGIFVARAQVVEHYTFTPNLAVPDGNNAGTSDSHVITGSGIASIGSLTVDLNIASQFNGDLYLYLRHEDEVSPGNYVTDGFSVLLNRVGRTLAQAAGYDDNGFDITLSDSASNGDIHHYRTVFTPNPGSGLTGTWQPDGRNLSPEAVLNTTSSTALLSQFDLKDVNGRWTLFAADLQSGGVSQLNSWSLNFTPVPEPQAGMIATALGLAAFGLIQKQRKRR
jgi:subtilisin-like proprotein convertase family protein